MLAKGSAGVAGVTGLVGLAGLAGVAGVIAEEGVAGLAGLLGVAEVCGVEGVAGLANTAGAELAELLGIKTVTKGLKVQLDDNRVVIDAIITVAYGCNIVKVAKEVQDKVAESVEATTGFEKPQVNVHVSGISFEK